MIRMLRTGALVALSALALAACGGDQKKSDMPPPDMPSAEPPQADPDAGATTQAPAASGPVAKAASEAPPTAKPDALSDEQIAAITDAANTAEIAQAKVAEKKSTDAGVKRFATMMISHHGEAKQKQAKLKLKTAESGISTAMEADAASTLNALKADTGKDFDKAYIAAQVDGHQKVLDTINDKLLPNVKSPELKAYLDEIKPKVESHLKEAKRLQESFDSKASSSASSKG